MGFKLGHAVTAAALTLTCREMSVGSQPSPAPWHFPFSPRLSSAQAMPCTPITRTTRSTTQQAPLPAMAPRRSWLQATRPTDPLRSSHFHSQGSRAPRAPVTRAVAQFALDKAGTATAAEPRDWQGGGQAPSPRSGLRHVSGRQGNRGASSPWVTATLPSSTCRVPSRGRPPYLALPVGRIHQDDVLGQGRV